jgi:hypothetical protein
VIHRERPRSRWPSLAAALTLALSACAPAVPVTPVLPASPPATPAPLTPAPVALSPAADASEPGRCVFGGVENLGSTVNSPLFDGSPAVSADERTIFFTSNRIDGQEDLFMVARAEADDPWGEPVSLGSVVNDPAADDNALRLSHDGNSLYFSSQRAGGYGSSDLYVTRRESPIHRWQTPENLGPLINTGAFEAFPTPSADGNTLYFNRSTTFDSPDSDIWMTTRSSENEAWSEPERLPAPVNGPGMEVSPAISADGLTLYFASGRPGSIGVLDLWMATRSGDGERWGEPESLGRGVNAPGSFTLAPFVSDDGRSLYFMSNRPGGLGGPDCAFLDCFDLYRATRRCDG